MFYVVYDREENGYHDSYFYAGFFNPETKEFFEKEYGSTAFPTVPRHVEELNGKIDRWVNGKREEIEFTQNTPQEVLELYYRVAKLRQRLKHRKQMQKLAKDMQLGTYHEAARLTKAFPMWEVYNYKNLDWFEFDAIYKLLKTKNFRSSFRKSLADQVRVWVKEETPKYAKPLSPRQLSTIVRR